MNYGCFNGSPISKADAYELGLVARCDECGEEFESDQLRTHKDRKWCEGCYEDRERKEDDSYGVD